ncbi:MAG: hypothetical protein KAV44_07965 [Bacteroidales bacterium]|jgi:hypothetical protein|nr:hypothetical protein [Bacteroidales bacterium]
MKKGIPNKDVITALRLKSKELLKDNERYEGLITENKNVIESLSKSIVALGGSINNDSGNVLKKTTTGGTFKDKVLKILEDGRPRTSRQLYNDYLKVVGETNIKGFYDFSGRFANITKIAGIKKHEIQENPINKRFFYGRSDWFDGDILKNDYLSKLDYDK